MLNVEKYFEEVKDAVTNKIPFAVVNGKVVMCQSGLCKACEFSGTDCNVAPLYWLFKEVKKDYPVTKKEYEFAKLCKPDCYVARDKNGELCIFSEKPIRSRILSDEEDGWDVKQDSISIAHTLLMEECKGIFDFDPQYITWEDEPVLLSDLVEAYEGNQYEQNRRNTYGRV